MSGSIKVLLADDHPVVREGIRAILRSAQDITVVGEAVDHHEAQCLSRELQPDILLLDLYMPGPTPTETVAYVRVNCPQTRVLVLTALVEDLQIRSLLSLGIAGYVLKDKAITHIGNAIRTVAQGGTWFSQIVISQMSEGIASVISDVLSSPKERELEILRLMAKGWKNAKIAKEIGISERTVRFHIGNLFAKLEVDNRTAAVTKAIRIGWIRVEE